MLEVGDFVKVTGKTLAGNGKEEALITIGTICRVVEVSSDGFVEIIPLNDKSFVVGYWYAENDPQKGDLVWVPEESEENEENGEAA